MPHRCRLPIATAGLPIRTCDDDRRGAAPARTSCGARSAALGGRTRRWRARDDRPGDGRTGDRQDGPAPDVRRRSGCPHSRPGRCLRRPADPRALGALRDVARTHPGPLASALADRADPETLLAAVIDELAKPPSPTVLVVEDAHWADGAHPGRAASCGPPHPGTSCGSDHDVPRRRGRSESSITRLARRIGRSRAAAIAIASALTRLPNLPPIRRWMPGPCSGSPRGTRSS